MDFVDFVLCSPCVLFYILKAGKCKLSKFNRFYNTNFVTIKVNDILKNHEFYKMNLLIKNIFETSMKS